MEELKKQAEELGIKVDGRWSEERLQAEIDKVLGDEPETAEKEAEGEPHDDGGSDEPESRGFERHYPTIKNLQANPNKRLGLAGFGSIQLTEAQLRDEQLLKRIQHGIDTGVLSAN